MCLRQKVLAVVAETKGKEGDEETEGGGGGGSGWGEEVRLKEGGEDGTRQDEGQEEQLEKKQGECDASQHQQKQHYPDTNNHPDGVPDAKTDPVEK